MFAIWISSETGSCSQRVSSRVAGLAAVIPVPARLTAWVNRWPVSDWRNIW